MDQDLRWVVGLILTGSIFVVGTLIAAFRNLAARISKVSGELHQRVDNVKDSYVRRDDLDSHLQRIDGNIRDLRQELRDGQQQVLEAIRNKD